MEKFESATRPGKIPATLVGFFFAHGRGLLIVSGGTGIVAGLAGSCLVALMNRHVASPAEAVQGGLVAFAAMLSLRMVTTIVSRLCLVHLGQRAVSELRISIAGMVHGASLLDFEKAGTARILSAFTEDIPHLANLITSVPLMGINLVVILSCLTYVSTLSLPLGAFTLLLMVTGILAYRLLMDRGIGFFREARCLETDLMEDFKTSCDGIKEIKLSRARKHAYLSSRLQRKADASKAKTILAFSTFVLADAFGDFLLFVPVGFALFLSPGWLHLTAASASKYVVALVFLFGPITSLALILPLVGRASASLGNLRDLQRALGLEPFFSHFRDTVQIKWPHGVDSLEVAGLTFQYPDGGFALGPLNFCLEPGEAVFLVGGNGNGKSTLAKLVTGLYQASAGSIRLGSVEVGPHNLAWYREHFSTVFANGHLFPELPHGSDGTYSDRIAKFEGFLRAFGLGDKVNTAEGEFTEIRLSQGQRKRLALVTALLEDRPIYVFDEWAAEQDPPFRRQFYEEIIPDLKCRGKMILVITHDDRYFHLADRVLRLECGKAEGNPVPGDMINNH